MTLEVGGASKGGVAPSREGIAPVAQALNTEALKTPVTGPAAPCEGRTIADTVCPDMRAPTVNMLNGAAAVQFGKAKLEFLSATVITERLKEQRATIESFVDASIEHYLALANRQVASSLLRAIKCFPTPEKGFEVLKDFLRHKDQTMLQDEVRKLKIPFAALIGMVNQQLLDDQRACGVNLHNPIEIVKRFSEVALATAILLPQQLRGGFSVAQAMVYETMKEAAPAEDEPECNHLRIALAEQRAQALSNILESLESLKEHATKRLPLIDENVVRSKREGILRGFLEQFDRLAAQSFDDTLTRARTIEEFPMVAMPEGVKFGMEFEGFVPSDEKFVPLMFKLTRLMRAMDLSASAVVIPKANQTYGSWSVTYDASVKNPLCFTRKQGAAGMIAGLGLEIVSPILEGADGQRQLATQLNVLRVVNMRTNESTGMHVHVDLKDASLDELKNLARALVKNEDKLQSLIDENRRHGKNRFCKSIPKDALAKIEEATSREEVVEALNPDLDRNMMFDMSGLVVKEAPPTIQYRGEGGPNCLVHAERYASVLVRFTQGALADPSFDLDSLRV